MAVERATRKELDQWNKKLESLGLGVGAGSDHHVVKYGFSVEQLENAYQEAIDRQLTPSVHQRQVELYLQETNRQSHLSRSKHRAAVKREKAALKARIWAR